MNIWRWIIRHWTGDPGEPAMLDHVDVQSGKDWRGRAITKAAKRHGRAFKTGPRHVAREVLREGKYVVAQAKQDAAEKEDAKVRSIKRAGTK